MDHKFYAFYTATKVGKASLTVTVDVYKASDNSKVVDNQAANAVAGGLYSYTYSSANADDYMAVFKTADATVDQQHIPALVIKQVPEIDNILADTGTDGVVVASMATDSITAAALKADAGAEIADAILDEAVVGSYTMRQLLKVMAAALAGKATGGGTTTVTFRGVDDASNVIVATVDANGNRSALTINV